MSQPGSQIRVKHILQKHTGSRNPFDSYRKKEIHRSKEEAIANIKAFRSDITEAAASEQMAKWDSIATQFSECRSAAAAGDLGMFGRGMMQKQFEDAAFSLQIGEISQIVDSDSGIHIILRTA